MPKRGSQAPSAKLDLPDTDPEATVEYMGGWHGLLPSTAGGGHRWTSITQLPLGVAYADDLAVMMDSIRSGVASLDELIYPPDSSKRQNLYHAVGVTKERPEAGKRGPASAVDAVPGAWADFDVRDGSFRDWAHILEIVSDMDHAGIGPQIIVSTGSGGAHCYWRAEGRSPETGLMYATRIRRWVQQRYGIKVDNVAQANRVMRLPGRFDSRKQRMPSKNLSSWECHATERYADLPRLKSSRRMRGWQSKLSSARSGRGCLGTGNAPCRCRWRSSRCGTGRTSWSTGFVTADRVRRGRGRGPSGTRSSRSRSHSIGMSPGTRCCSRRAGPSSASRTLRDGSRGRGPVAERRSHGRR